MPKKRRVTAARSPRKRPASKRSAAPERATPKVRRPEPQRSAPRTAPPPPVVAPRKPGYYEAISLYESGVRALQRHDFATAADHFRTVTQRYPDERELLERAHLYLRVCERETAQRPAGPQTVEERVYAATVALNTGDYDAALGHLRRALEQKPDSDHAHYITAVTLVSAARHPEALTHLRRAIELNPDNRSLALQDEDLGALQELDEFRQMTESGGSKRRTKARR